MKFGIKLSSSANADTEVIKELKAPSNIKKLQRFVGFINVYCKFVDKHAEIRRPRNR